MPTFPPDISRKCALLTVVVNYMLGNVRNISNGIRNKALFRILDLIE